MDPGWTPQTLKEHFDERLRALEKAVDDRLAAKNQGTGTTLAVLGVICAILGAAAAYLATRH